MKTRTKRFLILGLGLACMLGTSACKTVNQSTGQAEFDPVKTESVKAALEPVITAGIRRALAKSPRDAVAIGNYIREAGGIFCEMKTTGRFEPSFLISRLDGLFMPQLSGDVELILTVKDAAIAIYKINYAQRLTAELPPDEWAWQLADLFCGAIDRGLKSAGQSGVQ